MNKKSVYLNRISIPPSLWHLDIWISQDEEKLAHQFNKYYGASKEYYLEEGFGNWVSTIGATQTSIRKGNRTIIMCLKELDLSILVHELTHVLFHYGKASGCLINYESQEWVAMLFEYLYNVASKPGNYSLVK